MSIENSCISSKTTIETELNREKLENKGAYKSKSFSEEANKRWKTGRNENGGGEGCRSRLQRMCNGVRKV